ncbi:MAG: glutamine amidotransferase [Acidobacteriota bacterium]|nr:glutamine amidotransferase [Acidobacteriota bacterium]
MFESLFEFLFKYRPLVFDQGTLAFRPTVATYVATLLVIAVGVVTLRTYQRVRAHSRPVDRHVLTGIRLTILALLVLCLFRPVLVISQVEPQQNFLGVLIDDSRSMQIADRDGATRADFVTEQFGAESGLLGALTDRFAVRLFSFSNGTDRVEQAEGLSYDGTQTDLGQALTRAHEELSGVPLSGLVVVSDGADNVDGSLPDTLLPLQAAGVPVFTVGLGREEYSRDIQLSRIDTPRSVLKGAALVVDVVVAQTGYRGEQVNLLVEDEGRIVADEALTLPPDGEPATVRVRFTAADAGPRLFTFRIAPEPDEMVTQNNERHALIVVEDTREKVLYFEGEPRWEVKFLRRAVADDENLQLAVLQRTAENKFMRMGVEDADDLVEGFPRTRAELFQYRALILGGIEANHFTPDQLRMIADFVSERGGGLLMLGSRRSFAEGGYAGTPVADVLPVVIEERDGSGESEFFVETEVRPTRAGATHPATQIAETEETSGARWMELPPITLVNPVREVKPGATTLLTSGDEQLVVLAFQRYGAGKALAFPVQDSWMWQMHADIDVDDQTHETLWRRLLRWMVDGVPDQVVADLPQDRVELNESLSLEAEVDDANYEEVNTSQVSAWITDPDDELLEVAMDWTADRDGVYGSEFTPRKEGLYEVRIEATADGELLGSDTTYLRVAPSDSEYYDSTRRTSLLERIANETGGRFYTDDTVDALVDDVQTVGGGVTVIQERDLWDMPGLLLAFLLLVLGEWGYRRARGLA